MRYRILACDYDGTIATHGVVSASTVAALQTFRNAGGSLVLATGREVVDLQNIFPELDVFNSIVAENGAVLFDNTKREETLRAPPPSKQLLERLQARRVAPLYVGRVIVASGIHHAAVMEAVISELNLDLQVIPNKEAAMILPANCDKASGLRALFERSGLDFASAVGVGDAENDIPLLEVCALGVALSNALPLLKDRADRVMSLPAGDGVAELITQLLSTDGEIRPA